MNLNYKKQIETNLSSIKYIQDIRSHISTTPISVMIVDYTRCGSDFFQSLLDQHPEVIQFTGYHIFHDFWDLAKNKTNLVNLITEFVNFDNHLMKFKSNLNVVERWNELGENKNESFEVDIDLFKKIAFSIQDNWELNSKNFFLTINTAYFIASGFDIFKTKVLFYHLHRMDRLNRFSEDFSDFKLIIMTRDLRDGIISYFESRFVNKSDPYTFIPPILTYSNIFRNVQNFQYISFNVLKSLHKNPKRVLKNVCIFLNIKYLPHILNSSTWHGKLWWGDKWSNRDLQGFNNQFGDNPRWGNKLTFIDIYLMECLFEQQFKAFDYKIYYNKPPYLINLPIILFLIFLPMKYELKILFHNISRIKGINPITKTILSSFHVYLIRVKNYLKIFIVLLHQLTQQNY